MMAAAVSLDDERAGAGSARQDGVPPVWVGVVNLRRQPERRARMVEELARAGVEAEFIDAVDAREVGRELLLKEVYDRGPWGRLKLGHMGCTLSHIRALERFLSRPEPFALVLEDDVHISADLGDWVSEAPRWWPSDADVVKIECWRRNGTWLVMGPATRVQGRELRRLHSRHMGAAGYFVSRRAAERILAHRPRDMVIDHLLFNMNASPLARSLRLYQAQPALVRQVETPRGAAARPGETVPREKLEQGLDYWRRELRRGWMEINRAPRQAVQIACGRAILARPRWA